MSAAALDLAERQRASLRDLLPQDTEVLDVHTHLGQDIDGRSMAPGEHLAQMEVAGVERAVVFALDEPDWSPAYRAPNDRVLRWAADSNGRHIPFCRLALDSEPVEEARRCLALGARGIKLHPRAQSFRVDDARLEAVFALAAEHSVPVLIHAGRGLPPGQAEELARVAGRHGGASLILAHAAIAEQGRIVAVARDQRNVLFDTSTWTPLDVMALVGRVSPEQIMWASDAPYGSMITSQLLLLRLLEACDATDECVRAMMGGTAAELVEGRLPTTHSEPIAPDTLHVSFDSLRLHNYLAACMPLIWQGVPDTIGFVGLARGAARDMGLEEVDEMIVRGAEAWETSVTAADEEGALSLRRAAFLLINAAQTMALAEGLE